LPVWIGTSGWQYRHWRGTFYPPELRLDDWLPFYARAFATLESNNAFYRLPERSTFERWAERTPDDFVMAVKVSRFLTHIKRLKAPAEPVDRFIRHATGLGRKLGPVLLQLPPQLHADPGRLARALDRFPDDVRVAVEFRHASWFSDEVRRILEERSAALCLADRRSRPVTPIWRTAPWTYVRFHQGTARPRPSYGETALASWAARLAELWSPADDVFVYFNNDFRTCAPRDAARFAGRLRRRGFDPTRTPPVRSIGVRPRAA
jgi:uncharacterized protein YecE (DUF72 family)